MSATTILARSAAAVVRTTGQLDTKVDADRAQNAARQTALDVLLGMLYQSGSALANGFFGSDCLVSSSGGLNYSVATGMGLFYDGTITDAFTAQYRPIMVPTAITGSLGARDATNPRIDIICLAPDLTTDTSETVSVMAGDGSTSTTTLNRRSLYYRAIQIVAGTPAASPAAPSTPSGYIKIAQCLVPAAAGAITVTDYRPILKLSPDAIGAGAVTTASLADGAVTNVKITDGTIAGAKLTQVPCYAALTPAAESANTIATAIQIKDVDGNTLTGIKYVRLTLETVNGLVTDAAQYYFSAITTGTRVAETADTATGSTPYLLITTNSSGVANVTVTDAVGGVNRGVRLVATMMGSYGPVKYVQLPFA